MPTASRSSSSERVDECRGLPRAPRARARQAWELQAAALLRPGRAQGKSRGMTAEPIHDLAHIGHAELLTPYPEDSLRFFVELFGMEIEHRQGQSVFSARWGELPALRPEADRVRAARTRPHGDPGLEPGGPDPPGRRHRGNGSRRRLERRRPRPRAGLRVQGPTATLRDLLRAGSLRPPSTCAPLKNVRTPCRPRRRGQADRSRQRAGLRRGRRTGLRRPSSSATDSTSSSCTTTGSSRCVDESVDRRP